MSTISSRIAYVLIISDACRNAVQTFGALGTVAGKPALDLGAVAGVTPSKVDQFYATQRSQTAKEFNGEGFFTEVLLEALNTSPMEAVEVWPTDDPNVPVITAAKLEDYLSRADRKISALLMRHPDEVGYRDDRQRRHDACGSLPEAPRCGQHETYGGDRFDEMNDLDESP